ncbi:CD276 antigen [Electrophorus electricus]|uniref:CD276 antigen n=1 Tax=Electrophorus electricus TaxID=8005 RepID=UPI0015D0646C|nr:CD276 antigen [Electrophorus electricus]
MVWQVYVLCIVNCAAFKVSTPSSDLIAIRGQPTVLGCEFTSEPDPSLSSLVVTWQRPEDSQVVHSFYYGQDQLERQSLNYRNRTALFVSELKRGNASLRIEGVRSKDTGMYLCLVSNMKGTGRAQVRLVYGAFYTEPRLSISASPHGVTVQYESEGFPKPEVQWVGAEDQNLSHHTELTNDSDMAGGLYHLKSIYEAHTYPLSVTFTLKNRLLNQDLQKSLNLRYGEDETKRGLITAVIFLSIVCALLVIGMVFLLKKGNCYIVKQDTKNGFQVPLSSIE